jgi:hypothetical protein
VTDPHEPDSPALRARRSRLHRKGDHSLCRPERCPDAPPDDAGVSVALEAFLADLRFPEHDIRQVLLAVARKLAAALDRRPNGAIAHELGTVLNQLVEHPNEPADQVDELRARRAVRRMQLMLADVERGG